jgi:hypothetical protein
LTHHIEEKDTATWEDAERKVTGIETLENFQHKAMLLFGDV